MRVHIFFWNHCPPMACLALLAPLALPAQPLPDAADPAAPTAPLLHAAVPSSSPLAALPDRSTWRDAHDAVGSFPRGHADIVAWEARQAATTHKQPEPAHPSDHHRHGGQP